MRKNRLEQFVLGRFKPNRDGEPLDQFGDRVTDEMCAQ